MAAPIQAQEQQRLDNGAQTSTTTALNIPPDAANSVVATVDPSIGRVFYHYRLDEWLGAGGMGVLYRATDLRLGRAVAIKVLHRHLASDGPAKVRFIREARAASALDHPNIAAVHDIGEEGGELFLVMALYRGQTLKQRLDKGALPVEEAVGILKQVALGLEAAHRGGIIHRDIKPANVLLTRDGTVKILDFGLAKLASDTTGQSVTEAGHAMGTVLYMSPEQLRGKAVDQRSDLWSLGALGYELLSGIAPFQTDSSAATAGRILNDEPLPLTSVPGVPRWLADLIAQLLRKDPSERPQTASEVIRTLEGPARVPRRRRSVQQWFHELKRRRVLRVAAAYALASLALLPVEDVVIKALHLPDWTLTLLVVLTACGSPLSLVLAWIFDVKAGRIERTAPAPGAAGVRGLPLALLLGTLGVLAAAPSLSYYFVLRNPGRGLFAKGSSSAQSVPSLAILPFASLSTGEENAYFAQGFHDELLRQMGRIGDLRLISRTSVMQYKEGARNSREIAEALGVSSIVEGSVQRAGNRVRVEARLIDARNDRQIWGEHYDRDVSDVLGIQTAVAEEIAAALNARLSPAQKAQLERKPTQSAEAYELYLRALEYARRPGFFPGDLELAERLYRQAIEKDPSFALARARLADLLTKRYHWVAGTPDSVVEAAREEAERALRLQPDLPEAHLAMGLYHYYSRLDYDRALPELEAARPGLPAEAVWFIGGIQRRQGKFDEAIRSLYQANLLDPRSPRDLSDLAITLLYTRRYEEADRVLDRVLVIAPDFVTASLCKALVRERWKGDVDTARAVLRDVRGRLAPHGRLGLEGVVTFLFQSNPTEALALLESIDSDSIDFTVANYPKALYQAEAHEALGDASRAAKEYESARVMLEAEVEKFPDGPFQRVGLARAYAGLGRKEDALRETRRGLELLPTSKDALFGSWLEVDVAAVEARVGETDAAIERLRRLISIPSWLSPALLRIERRWAPLRDDPRFRKLAELDRE